MHILYFKPGWNLFALNTTTEIAGTISSIRAVPCREGKFLKPKYLYSLVSEM